MSLWYPTASEIKKKMDLVGKEIGMCEKNKIPLLLPMLLIALEVEEGPSLLPTSSSSSYSSSSWLLFPVLILGFCSGWPVQASNPSVPRLQLLVQLRKQNNYRIAPIRRRCQATKSKCGVIWGCRTKWVGKRREGCWTWLRFDVKEWKM